MIARDDTRRRILDAAEDLIGRFGPSKTSVADVARALHMSPANIYNFFPSRDALLEELGESHFGALRCALQARLADAPDPWSAICTLFIHTSLDIRERIGNEKDVIQLQILSSRPGWRFVQNFHAFMLASLERQIRALVGCRDLRGLDPAAAAAALFDCLVRAIDPVLILHTPAEEHERRLHAQLDLLERAFMPVHGTM